MKRRNKEEVRVGVLEVALGLEVVGVTWVAEETPVLPVVVEVAWDLASTDRTDPEAPLTQDRTPAKTEVVLVCPGVKP